MHSKASNFHYRHVFKVEAHQAKEMTGKVLTHKGKQVSLFLVVTRKGKKEGLGGTTVML